MEMEVEVEVEVKVEMDTIWMYMFLVADRNSINAFGFDSWNFLFILVCRIWRCGVC